MRRRIPKITEKLREQAADICQLCASNGPWTNTATAADALGMPHVAFRLAHRAFWAASADSTSAYAEAEAMLRCGEFPR